MKFGKTSPPPDLSAVAGERKGSRQAPARRAVVQAEIAAAEADFGDRGRVLVRFSGTELLARVMVEGENLPQVEHWAHRIAGTLRDELATLAAQVANQPAPVGVA